MLNSFLNGFDRFLRRLAAIVIVLFIIPFLSLAYLFGVFDITSQNEDE